MLVLRFDLLVGAQRAVMLVAKANDGEGNVHAAAYLRDGASKLIGVFCLAIGDDEGHQRWPLVRGAGAKLLLVDFQQLLEARHDIGSASPTNLAPFLVQVIGVEVFNVVSLATGEGDGAQSAALLFVGSLGILFRQFGYDELDGFLNDFAPLCWAGRLCRIIHRAGGIKQEHWLFLFAWRAKRWTRL